MSLVRSDSVYSVIARDEISSGKIPKYFNESFSSSSCDVVASASKAVDLIEDMHKFSYELPIDRKGLSEKRSQMYIQLQKGSRELASVLESFKARYMALQILFENIGKCAAGTHRQLDTFCRFGGSVFNAETVFEGNHTKLLNYSKKLNEFQKEFDSLIRKLEYASRECNPYDIGTSRFAEEEQMKEGSKLKKKVDDYRKIVTNLKETEAETKASIESLENELKVIKQSIEDLALDVKLTKEKRNLRIQELENIEKTYTESAKMNYNRGNAHSEMINSTHGVLEAMRLAHHQELENINKIRMTIQQQMLESDITKCPVFLRNYMDISGSMSGSWYSFETSPIALARESYTRYITTVANSRPDVNVDVIGFNHQLRKWYSGKASSVPKKLPDESPSGSTNFTACFQDLREASNGMSEDAYLIAILVTDGEAPITDSCSILKQIAAQRKGKFILFVVGITDGCNKNSLEQLSIAANGSSSMIIDGERVIDYVRIFKDKDSADGVGSVLSDIFQQMNDIGSVLQKKIIRLEKYTEETIQRQAREIEAAKNKSERAVEILTELNDKCQKEHKKQWDSLKKSANDDIECAEQMLKDHEKFRKELTEEEKKINSEIKKLNVVLETKSEEILQSKASLHLEIDKLKRYEKDLCNLTEDIHSAGANSEAELKALFGRIGKLMVQKEVINTGIFNFSMFVSALIEGIETFIEPLIQVSSSSGSLSYHDVEVILQDKYEDLSPDDKATLGLAGQWSVRDTEVCKLLSFLLNITGYRFELLTLIAQRCNLRIALDLSKDHDTISKDVQRKIEVYHENERVTIEGDLSVFKCSLEGINEEYKSVEQSINEMKKRRSQLVTSIRLSKDPEKAIRDLNVQQESITQEINSLKDQIKVHDNTIETSKRKIEEFEDEDENSSKISSAMKKIERLNEDIKEEKTKLESVNNKLAVLKESDVVDVNKLEEELKLLTESISKEEKDKGTMENRRRSIKKEIKQQEGNIEAIKKKQKAQLDDIIDLVLSLRTYFFDSSSDIRRKRIVIRCTLLLSQFYEHVVSPLSGFIDTFRGAAVRQKITNPEIPQQITN